jgi:hypothetical protein
MAARGRKMSSEVMAALIAATAQMLAAIVALVGTFVAAEGQQEPSGDRPLSMDVPASSLSWTRSYSATVEPCTHIVMRYQRLVAANPMRVRALTMRGRDDVSPVSVDPDARRCAINARILRILADP